MEKTAPRPVFGPLTQPSSHRVPVNVVNFLYKLLMIANVEVVVAFLPELLRFSDQAPCDSLLQRLHGVGQRVAFRLAYQKMNMLRHDDVRVDAQAKVAAHALQGGLEGLSTCVGCEQRTAVITAESYEVALARVLIALEAPRHEISVAFATSALKAKRAARGLVCQNGRDFVVPCTPHSGKFGDRRDVRGWPPFRRFAVGRHYSC